jgi:hypothetical protein
MICLIRRGDEAGARRLHETRFRESSHSVLAAIAALGEEMKRRPQLFLFDAGRG